MHKQDNNGNHRKKVMAEEKTVQIENLLEDLADVNRINLLAARATVKNCSFAFYRMPNDDKVSFIAGKKLRQIDHEDLSSLGDGYLISNFIGQHYYFDKEMSYTKTEGGENLSYLLAESDKNNEQEWRPYIIANKAIETDEATFIGNVSAAIKEISHSDLLKVVPSKTKRIELKSDQIPEIFVRLCQTYPTAFVSITSAPELGTWVGATPESLIEVDKKGIFKTMSLAGTQKYIGEPLHTLPWTQKEIEEQAMVSRYIINRFKEIRLREFIEVGPRTVSAGNMAHLCTTFTVDTIETEFPDLGSVMLKLLHPTSAVCGMPKQAAQNLIKKLENHDRRLFSGYLGPVNMAEGSYIYVNLRCMEIQDNQAILYAGAGVTQYSVPEDEWQETELKCNTLLNVIEN